MTLDELHQFFDLELDKTTSLENTSFLTEEKDDWLNQAIKKFTKSRYSGVNIKRESFEQTQKRIDDLRTLVVEKELTCTTGTVKPNSTTFVHAYADANIYRVVAWRRYMNQFDQWI